MKIKNIFFDLGNVLVYFDHTILLNFFEINEKNNNKLKKLFIDFNCGRISAQDFYIRIKIYLKKDISFEKFKKIWSEIFELNNEMLDFAVLMKRQDKNIFIISNTDELHFNYIINKWKELEQFDGYILSYRVGAMKPDPVIYKYAIEKYNIIPQESLIIDDLPENIEGAKKFDFNTVLFKDNGDFKEKISKFDF